MIKRVAAIILLAAVMSSCGTHSDVSEEKISVIGANFAAYDFARAVAGDAANVEMLLPPGSESHSFEPTPQDIIAIQQSEIFICVGGESDAWIKKLAETAEGEKMRLLKMLECVETVNEEMREGMQAAEEDEDEPELDEHVWTSPANAVAIIRKICELMCGADSENAALYEKNANAYIEKLNALDSRFKALVDSAARREIIFADRFPLRYFADAYGLEYYAAFPGCSDDTEPSAATVAALIDRVKRDKIPVVFHVELSNEKMADTVSEATGAEKRLFSACHNVTRDEFSDGVTYIDIMEKNLAALEEALN